MRSRATWPLVRLSLQLLVAAAFLASWQWLPRIHFLAHHFRFLDPFFISSPTQVSQTLYDLALGRGTIGVTLWPYLYTTVYSALLGSVAGLLLGGIFGLAFSNFARLGQVIRPFIILANSVPRVAVIPIIVVLVGPTVDSSVISVITVVFFLGFFAAFEGGNSIGKPVLEHARLLGANNLEIMRSIRLPMVLIGLFGAVPNIISFGLIVAVTTELLAGVHGMGFLLLSATTNVNAPLTFAIIVALSIVGLVMYWGALGVRRLVIRWDGAAARNPRAKRALRAVTETTGAAA